MGRPRGAAPRLRRHLADGQLRPRTRPALLGDRQPVPGHERRPAPRRQPVHESGGHGVHARSQPPTSIGSLADPTPLRSSRDSLTDSLPSPWRESGSGPPPGPRPRPGCRPGLSRSTRQMLRLVERFSRRRRCRAMPSTASMASGLRGHHETAAARWLAAGAQVRRRCSTHGVTLGCSRQPAPTSRDQPCKVNCRVQGDPPPAAVDRQLWPEARFRPGTDRHRPPSAPRRPRGYRLPPGCTDRFRWTTWRSPYTGC